MNIIAMAHGRIVFSRNLYYNNRATEFFSAPALMCPLGFLLPMGPPVLQLRDWAFNPTLLPDDTCVGMNTAMLVERTGRIAHVEFNKTNDGEVKMYRQYFDTDSGASWAVSDSHRASIVMSGLVTLTKSPLEALTLLGQVETIVMSGYEEWKYEDLVEYVQKSMAVLDNVAVRSDAELAKGAKK